MAAFRMLKKHLDERAGFKIAAAKPRVEDIENREQLLRRRGATALNACLKPGTGPQLLASAQEGKGKLVLGRVVFVQRPLRDPGSRSESVNTHRTNTVP